MKKNEYEVRKDFIRYYGFETLTDFANALGDDIANTSKILKGIQKPTIEKMIKYAIVLNAEIDEIISLFYADDMKKYEKAKEKAKNKKKTAKKK